MKSDQGPIPRALNPAIQAILSQYPLDPHGPHGVMHWARVLENGRRLARSTGATEAVVDLFAIFHDSCRIDEGHDPEHGIRGAGLARALRGIGFHLPDEDFVDLHEACAGHTGGKSHPSITVQTCWDADRLDLGRVGIRPQARLLCTAAARTPTILKWASERGFSRQTIPWVRTAWGFDYRERAT